MNTEAKNRTNIPENLRFLHNKCLQKVWSSIRKNQDFLLFAKKRNTRLQKEVKLRLFQNIDEFPLHNFVDCLCEGRYESLYRDSLPRNRFPEMEQAHFAQLYYDYTDRMLEGDSSVYENLKRVALYAARVAILEATILMRYAGKIDQETTKMLRSFGIRLTPFLEKDLLVLSAHRANAIRKFELAKEKVEAEKQNSFIQDRAYFLKLLAQLSNHFKFNISFLQITVGEFCSYYLQMKADTNAIKSAQNRRNGRKYK